MSTAVGDVAVGLLGWEWGARAAATSERGGACGECGFESGEGERLALNGMEATRERSAGERDADPDRAAPVVEAGASISRPLMLSGPEAVRAERAEALRGGHLDIALKDGAPARVDAARRGGPREVHGTMVLA
jgi:hypothetical protein